MEKISKQALVFFIIGSLLTAVCGIDLDMKLWGFFPSVIVAIFCGGYISSKSEGVSFRTFFFGALPILLGAAAMEVILLGA